MLVICLVALLVLGPQQLPKAMRTLGSVMAEVRKVSNSFQAEMRNAMDSVVDVSGNEKPQSGTMASASPYRTADDDERIAEIVANNGASAAGDPDSSTVDESSGAAMPETEAADAGASERPAIDPADRAAG